MAIDPEELTTAWLDAWRTKDADAIERMIAAEYVYVAPNGALMGRDSILAIIRDATYRITEGGYSEVVVTPLGSEVALVRHRWQGRGTIHGQVFVDDHRCVMIWYRVAGEWRVQYEQASPVVP
jgi:ketosteroid isomerase-like protein